jgi:hypothetical protein
MKAPSLDVMRLAKLRDHLTARRFAIPKLQRHYVWDANRAAKLWDSVFKGMPIGSLFLWEMDRKSANLIRQSADVLPVFNDEEPRIWFVIDGQQRLSVVHQAFAGEKKKNDAGREIDFGRLCFVVSPDGEVDDPPRVVYRKPSGKSLISLKDILAPDWKKRMPVQSIQFRKKVKRCRDRLLSYPVPVVTVRGATLDEIGEVFIRLNAQGMRITSADRAIALMGNIDVRAMAAELRQAIRDDGFGLSGLDCILMGFNLVTERPKQGDPPKLEAMARRWSKRINGDEAETERFRALWHEFKKAFLAAVSFLRHRFPIYDESYLPSANMLATLAVFFFHHPAPPSRLQSAEIRKWFWATGVAQRYSGRGYHENIVSDARFFESLAKGTRRRFVLSERLDPALDIQGSVYTSRAARTRAFFCLLAEQKPRYLETGEEIPLGEKLSHANTKNRHHIFPKAQLAHHFPARVYNSLCNMCFLVSRDNQKIGMSLPRKYLERYKNGSTRRFRQIVTSHLIPASVESGIWNRGIVSSFKEFRKERLQLICAEFERAAGIKLFRKM